MEQTIVLKAEKICKSFGPTKALVDVDLELYAGEVLGLIGENGSGKSTFSTIVAGTQKADSGTLTLFGEPYAPAGITDAMAHGISMVVQEQGTLNGISVAANIFAGRESLFSHFGVLDVKKMNRAAAELLTRLGVDHITPETLVDGMSFEDRKLLEVARAEFNDPKILIVDETTTALGKEGRGVMYGMMERMRGKGRSVIFISHDIDELAAVCDKVTVLRDGHIVGSLERDEMDQDRMKQMMVGRKIAENFYRTDWERRLSDEVALHAEHIVSGQLHDVSLEVHKGEILGFGGLTDCGMHELGKVLFGLTAPDVGRVLAGGGEVKSAGQAIDHKIGYVSKNRDTEALMGAGSIRDNMCLPMLPRLARHGLVPPKAEMALVEEWRRRLSIKMSGASQFCMQLSGGNKQKVSIAKWLACNPDVLIFDCPTRGIDIGVKSDIYELLNRLKHKGKAIIMISEELPELIGMSDRILIFKDGRIKGEFDRSEELTESKLIGYMI